MSLKYLLIPLFLLFISSVVADDTSISSFIDDVRLNPKSYTIVIGKGTPTEEIKVISDLASYLGITRSRFDTEITSTNNLVIVGTKNNLIKSMIGEFKYGSDKSLIKLSENNLIITAENIIDLQLAIDIVKNYENNKKSLNKQEYIAIQLLSPKNPKMWLALIAVVGIIVISTLALTKTKKPKTTNIQQQNPTLEQQLFQYIQSNLQKDYSKQQIRQALVNSNWDSKLVDTTLNRFP